MPSALMAAYGGTINNAFLAATQNYATGVMTKEAALQQFKDDVALAYNELSIES